MKRSIGAIGLALLLAPTAFARSRTAPAPRQQSFLARVTVYWASGGRGSDGYTRRHKCATGVRLRVGHCAVDPRRIPYGSKVVFPDGVFTAVDTGGAVITRKAARRAGRTALERSALVIDRFFETKRASSRLGECASGIHNGASYSAELLWPGNSAAPKAFGAATEGSRHAGRGRKYPANQTDRRAMDILAAPFGRMRRH